MKKVLIADDNDMIRETLTHVLRNVGCEVTAVSDGEAAIDACLEAHYLVVFTDFDMGSGINGIQLAEHLATRISKKPGKIVLMTASFITLEQAGPHIVDILWKNAGIHHPAIRHVISNEE